MSDKHIAPVEAPFRESIDRAAASLSKPTTEVPKTLAPQESLPEKITLGSNINKTEDVVNKKETTTDPEIDAEAAKPAEPIIEAGTKIENKAAKKAETTIVEEAKIDDFEFDNETKDYLRDVYGKTEDKNIVTDEEQEVRPGKKSKRTEEIEEEYKPYVTKAAEYDAILNDPMAKAFLEFRKNGGTNPADFIKSTGIVDVKNMTPEQLIEIDMKSTGLTAEQMAEELERFKEMSPYAQKKATKSIQDELERQNDEKLKTFTGQSIESDKVVREAISRGQQELKTVIPKMEGKSYKGLLITAEMLKRVEQDVVDNPVPIHDKSGKFIGFDIQESIRRSIILNYDEQRSKALIELGKTLGADRALKSRIRPDKKETGTGVVPTQTQSLEDIGKNVAKDLWKKRGYKEIIK